jgi:hypothetical protein
MAKRARPAIELKVEFVPLPPELETAWHASLLLLLNILKSDICDVTRCESSPIFIVQTCKVQL